MHLCSYVCLSHMLDMLYNINKGCVPASSQLFKFTLLQHIALYHGDSWIRILVLQRNIKGTCRVA
jgi:hypothetical protein